MDEYLIDKLEYYAQILEEHFHDMMDIEFTVEKGKIYILSASVARRSALANLKIVMGMFCEGKMSVEDVLKKIPYKQVEDFLDVENLINTDELELIGRGLAASGGIGSATVCFWKDEAEYLIDRKEEFVLCQIELSPDTVDVIQSKYCQAVITARGGMTSHAAVACRGMHRPCVSGFGDFYNMKELIHAYNNQITVDGNNGKIYAGIGKIKKNNANVNEIKILYDLLLIVIKYNVITAETAPLVWRLWDVIVLHKRFRGCDNTKQFVGKTDYNYRSFKQLSANEIDNINSKLHYVENCNFLVEDLIGFLTDQLSAQVSVGSHYLYMRPLMNPIDTMKHKKVSAKTNHLKPAGVQLTGIEFFNINRFVDFLLDIYSIKIFYCTDFFSVDTEDIESTSDIIYKPLNYLDYTNPCGEGLIINTYNAKKVAIYINEVLIPADKLMHVYHLLRRRKYHWLWYEENNISKKEIIDYLKSNAFFEDNNSKICYLCEEMQLIKERKLTLAGISLLGGENMETNRNIDYILDEVLARGCTDNSSDFNDFSILIQRKDFKDLIALELYEYYFWNERHEFDLQLLKEIVENVSGYFSDPEVIRQIEAGILQTLPSAIIVSMVATIWAKVKQLRHKKYITEDEDSSWVRIEKNVKKIDSELSNHDHVLSDDIEKIFGASREEIQPLLKLCGCKCFIDKKRSIWIKAGTNNERIRELLKAHHFKYR